MPSHETTETNAPAPEKKLYYTLEQANDMIPELELIFIRIQQMQIQVQSLFKMVKKQGIDFFLSHTVQTSVH